MLLPYSCYFILFVSDILLKAGCCVNVQNLKGETPLIASVSAELLTYKCILLLLYSGSDITIQDNKGNGALDTMLLHGEDGVSRRRLGQERCMCLLYAAGDRPRNKDLLHNVVKFRELHKMLLEDGWISQDYHGHDIMAEVEGVSVTYCWKLYSLTNQCRKLIRQYLLDPDGPNHSNLLLAIPRLPLPTRLKQFLVFFVDIKLNIC